MDRQIRMEELGLALIKIADLEFRIKEKEQDLVILRVELNKHRRKFIDFYNLVNQYIEDTKNEITISTL